MKRAVFISLLATVAAIATACAYEPIDGGDPGAASSLTLRLSVEEIVAGNPATDTRGETTLTRGTVAAVTGETNVNTLRLLFYDYKADGTGAFVKTVEVPANRAMVGSYTVTFDDDFSADNDYVILALANVEDFLAGQTLAGFLDIMKNLTEKQAVEQASVAVTGVDADERNNSRAIDRADLLMSARVVRLKADSEVEIKLTRGVVRFDVYLEENPQTAGYSLESVSIWSAATSQHVWYDRMAASPERTKRFYGMNKEDGDFDGQQIVGGLYAFENFSASPRQNDAETTCLVIGIKHGETTSYYRVNVSQSQASQNLARNHVYKVRIHEVPAAGADNEYNAWSQSRSLLTVSIVAWNLADNGMVITDGVNTMVMPVKLARLDPLGDVREYTVYTIGSETLTISKKSLPGPVNSPYIRAELIGGSLLRITADPIPTTGDEANKERRGSIELSYGGLRGSISFIQTPDESLYLELSRYEVPSHSPMGGKGIPDNVPLTVSASGAWTATIYNTDTTDPDNPGFSFDPASVVTTLRSGSNPFGNAFQIYTTGENTTDPATERSGYVMVTLDESPADYSRVVVLTQQTQQKITFKPALSETLRFTSVGVPTGVSGATAADGYVFDLDPGMTDGVPNGWTISSASPGEKYFEVTKMTSPVNRIIIRPTGVRTNGDEDEYPYQHRYQNRTTSAVSAVYTVKLAGADEAAATFTVTQDGMNISVTTYGTTVPAAGGEIRGVAVNIGEGLHWTATVSGSGVTGHNAYLLNGSTKSAAIDALANKTGADKLVVGFPKLYYPNVNMSPSVTVTVALAENPAVTATFNVTQQKLDPTAQPLNILDVKNTDTAYGSLTGPYHYLARYRDYLNSTALFGPNGKVKTGTVTISAPAPAVIPDSYSYVHAGGRPASYSQTVHNAVNEWFDAYGKERLLVYVADNADPNIFKGGTLKTVLSRLEVEYKAMSGTATVNAEVSATKLYKYIVEDGPFGAAGTNATGWVADATSSTATNLKGNMVKLIQDSGGGAFLFIDPENNLVFLGESQLFDIYQSSATTLAAGADKIVNAGERYRSVFLANLQAWMLNAAQYGTAWTDMFLSAPTSPAYQRVVNDTGKRPEELYEAAKSSFRP